MFDAASTALLHGVRVVDLTHALAGPLCTHQLHCHGAEVIKVEPPGRGDDFRARPFGRFDCINGGKKSVTLNLKSAEARAVLARMMAEADVVVENFRPGVAAAFGLDWEAMKAANPRLIYCSISGFGQSGPMRDMPAIEWSAQSVSGIADAYLSDNDDAMDLGIGMLDPGTGFMAFSAIVAALYRRTQTGEGGRIDVAMIDTAFLLGANAIAAALLGGPVSLGRRPTMARYRTKEGRIFIASLHPRWFDRLCRLIDAPDLPEDPRFADHEAREANAEALVAALEEKLAAKTALDWEALLVAEGIPAGACRSFTEFAATEHAQQRGLTETFGTETGEIEAVGAAFRLDGSPTGVRGPTPALGASTDEVLAELGYDADAIARMRGAGAI
ncbi:CaiB/BaiF CoA-transferase family protein [Psychromarinibacter sp. C21-152]|uniref:CaiB/BaiF CoA-transferase family protein n=1 Tax=Psychromarinibacter sediminicola TaxID=3033385 RepID=A0AAE3NQX0_9RHOB|nr:CaiB/BaiF CoA-transferase family protein [Psychromarinibacter sediminicola]MDF0599295.1 CaiB/BaiF CoA-transferase family protein [Psychromarinibacter sediminicola]